MILVQLVRLARNLRSNKIAGVLLVFNLLAISILGNAVCFYVFERHTDSSLTFGDALWYSVISVTTIGYGDYSASTIGARIGTVVFIVIIGLSAFSVFFGMVIDWATAMTQARIRGTGKVVAMNHTVIVNYPSTGRVRQLIDELKSDVIGGKSEIVIVTDQISELPFQDEQVAFIQGSPLEADTFKRARISEAKLAIVLARSYDDTKSDALVSAAASIIDSLNPETYIVAECLDDRHRPLFESVRCDAIVSGLRIAGNLLVQEVNDPGVTQMVEVVTSNLFEATLFSTQVDEGTSIEDYNQFAKALLDRDINMLCVNRGKETFTNFAGVRPTAGDRVIYIANRRLSWPELAGLAG